MTLLKLSASAHMKAELKQALSLETQRMSAAEYKCMVSYDLQNNQSGILSFKA